MSTGSDVTGTEEETGKGTTPKEEMTCESILGDTSKRCITVI